LHLRRIQLWHRRRHPVGKWHSRILSVQPMARRAVVRKRDPSVLHICRYIRQRISPVLATHRHGMLHLRHQRSFPLSRWRCLAARDHRCEAASKKRSALVHLALSFHNVQSQPHRPVPFAAKMRAFAFKRSGCFGCERQFRRLPLFHFRAQPQILNLQSMRDVCRVQHQHHGFALLDRDFVRLKRESFRVDGNGFHRPARRR